MALLFFGLAAYVTFESVRSIVTPARTPSVPGRHRPGRRVSGDHAVPLVGAAPHRTHPRLKRRRGRLNSNSSLHVHVRRPAPGLSPQRHARLVAGGSVAGLVIAGIAVEEGRYARRGEGCCAPPATASLAAADECGCGSGCSCCTHDVPAHRQVCADRGRSGRLGTFRGFDLTPLDGVTHWISGCGGPVAPSERSQGMSQPAPGLRTREASVRVVAVDVDPPSADSDKLWSFLPSRLGEAGRHGVTDLNA